MRESQGGGAPLRVLAWIDELECDVECGDKQWVSWKARRDALPMGGAHKSNKWSF